MASLPTKPERPGLKRPTSPKRIEQPVRTISSIGVPLAYAATTIAPALTPVWHHAISAI